MLCRRRAMQQQRLSSCDLRATCYRLPLCSQRQYTDVRQFGDSDHAGIDGVTGVGAVMRPVFSEPSENVVVVLLFSTGPLDRPAI